MDISECKPGTRVRLTHLPDRIGTITQAPPRQQGDTWRVQVHFTTGKTSWTRADNLEADTMIGDFFQEVEAGAFHPVSLLRRQLLHEKLNGRLSNVLYSMETSDTEFHAFQFKPVFRLIESPTNGILIADEVGLGKTIETGLIWTELRARSGARNLLVVCPPHLRLKWEEELRLRFGVKARVSKAEDIERDLRHWRDDRSHTFAHISSYQSLRPPDGWEEENPHDHRNGRVRLAHLLMELANVPEPPFDLLAVDEAHYMRNPETATAELGGLLCPVGAHRVFLSATPIHTSNDNLFALLRLLDPDTYTNLDTFRGILNANAPLVALRDGILSGAASRAALLKQVDDALRSPMLRNSRTLAMLRDCLAKAEDLRDPELRSRLAYQVERSNLLGSMINRSRKRDVLKDIVQREPVTCEVDLDPLERELYMHVTRIVTRYAVMGGIPTGFLDVMPQRQVASCAAAALERWMTRSQAWSAGDDRELPDDLPEDTGRPLIDYIRSELPFGFTPRALEEVDTKYGELRRLLRNYWDDNPGKKVILFAYFKPTLHYLQRRLRADGVDSLLLEGGTTRRGVDGADAKKAIIDEFRKPDSARLLLSSEVGGEGLDLQFAGVLINYDLPWNPMVVEQRIGRIDRIGQKQDKILIFNIIAKETVDERIYRRLYQRLDLFRRALGDLGEVLGPLVSDLRKELLTHQLNEAQQEEKIDLAERALAEQVRQHEEMESKAAVLAAYGDYILQQINSKHARQQWITALDIELFVTDFFRAEFPATRIQGLDSELRLYEIELDGDAAFKLTRYLEKNNLQGQTRLAHQRRHRIRFEHRTFTIPQAGVEVVHQSHPLVRFACDWLRGEGRLSALPSAIRIKSDQVPGEVVPGTYAFVVQRWTVEGLRSSERLSYHVLPLDTDSDVPPAIAEQLVEASVLGRDWPAARVDLASEGCAGLATILRCLDERAGNEFHDFEEQCRSENEDRARIQLNAIRRYRNRRVEVLRGVKARHIDRGRDNLVAATDGLIRDHLALCDARERAVREKARIEGGYDAIAMGIIEVKRAN